MTYRLTLTTFALLVASGCGSSGAPAADSGTQSPVDGPPAAADGSQSAADTGGAIPDSGAGAETGPSADVSMAPAHLTVDKLTATLTGIAGCIDPARALVTVSNSGGAVSGPLTATVTGAFTLGTNTCQGHTLAPGASCDIELLFATSVGGETHETLTISAEPGGQATTALTGVAVYGESGSLQPSSLDFSATVGESSQPLTTTLSNSGGAPSMPLETELAGTDFLIVNDTCNHAVLQPGASCVVTLVFHPLTLGSKTGLLTVRTTNRCGNVTVVAQLAGTSLPSSKEDAGTAVQ
jgi:hypothetical protein